MFYLDQKGKKQDADLHADLLDGVDATDETLAIRADLLAEGWTEQEIDCLWPAPKAVAA